MLLSRTFLVAVSVLASGTIVDVALALTPDPRPPTPAILDVAVGLNGRYKIGRWTPVTVTLSASPTDSAGRVEVICPDGEARLATYSAPARLTSGQPTRATAYVRPGQWQCELTITVSDHHGEVLTRRTVSAEAVGRAMSVDQELVVVVGPPIGIDAANELAERSTAHGTDRKRIEVAAFDTIEQLPHDARGLDAADWIILSTSRTESFARLGPDAPAVQALRRWVERGGRMVTSVGREANTVINAGGALSWTAPGKFAGMSQLPQLGALEGFIESTDTADQTPEGGLEVARLTDVDGVVEAADGGRQGTPLVVRRAFGFGQIVFVTFDLDSPALARWPGRPKLINRLLMRRPGATELAEPRGAGGSAMSAKAYVDLAEQLRDSVDQFPTITRVPVGGILAAVAMFLVVVGPLDYYVVRRRPQWTWLTFAVSVVLFVGGAGWLSSQLRPEALRASQVGVIDVEMAVGGEREEPLIRGSTWLNVYSPRAENMSLAFAAGTAGMNPAALQGGEPPIQSVISAPPTAGRAFQGASALAFTQIYVEPYHVEDEHGRLSRVAVMSGATQATFVEWDRASPNVAVTSLTLDALGRPRGEFVQPLGVDLDDCVLYAGTSAYRLGRVAAGERIKFNGSLEPQSAVARLTRRRMIEDRQTAAPYDPASLDVSRVLEMMLFHELAGGEGYTRLRNDVYGRLDLSGHLALDRAILVGTSRQGANRLSIATASGAVETIQATDTSLTIYRFVIPLKRAD